MKHALLATVLVVAATAQARATAYGLAIGNNAAPPGIESLPTLRYADDDATRFFQFFSRFTDDTRLLSVLDAETQRRYPEVGSVARPPSVAELTRAVAELAQRVRADVAHGDSPTVYISFSGHGAQDEDGTASLALTDGRLTRLQLYDEVVAPLQPAFVHLFIDACHAEGVVGGRGADLDAPTVAISTVQARAAFEVKLPSRFPRLGALLATTVDQQAHEWSRIESGVFTHELLSALSGAADVNGDGVVEYSEVHAFVASANRDLADPRAVPKVVVLAPRLDLHVPLISLSRFKNTGFLLGPFSVGRFYVELASGQRALDAHLAVNQRAMVAVPAGRIFVVASGKEAEVLLHDGEMRRAESLRFVPKADSARGALSATLGRDLFQSPFGANYYQGYIDSLGETSVVFPPAGTVSAFEQREQRKGLATGLWVAAGALLVGAMGSGIGAGVNQSAYEQTQLQRPAAEARERVTAFSIATGVTGGLAVGAALAGWWLWPGQGAALSFQLNQRGAALGVAGTF